MRSALRLLLLFALITRALVPTGFMPVAAADGHGLTLVICNGSGELQFVTLDDEGKQVPSNSEKASHEPCAFAGNIGLTAPTLDVATLLHITETELALSVGSDVVLPPVCAGPPLGSRAPPHHS